MKMIRFTPISTKGRTQRQLFFIDTLDEAIETWLTGLNRTKQGLPTNLELVELLVMVRHRVSIVDRGEVRGLLPPVVARDDVKDHTKPGLGA